MSGAIIIGLISDTHGLVRPEVFAALAGVSRIFHAGDVGPPEVLTELPYAVQGEPSSQLLELTRTHLFGQAPWTPAAN